MRSLLTMLGIIIGIASIIAIASRFRGTNEQLKQNLLGQEISSKRKTLRPIEYEFDDYTGIPVTSGLYRATGKMLAVEGVEDIFLHQPELFQRRLVSEHESPGCVHHGYRQPLFQYLRL